MLKMYKMRHPKADIDRLYVKRKEVGRGMVQVEAAYKAEIINIPNSLTQSIKKTNLKTLLKTYNQSIQPNMNSIFKLTAKIIEGLIQLN
jgi:hypothetical protein